ncbi:UNVERIFIED_CONTAM: hypothetical protein FKN15_027244 [Acipenser sinensis]
MTVRMFSANPLFWCKGCLLHCGSRCASPQVWDAVDSGRCWKTYSSHSGAVRDACWSSCGRNILSGSFDATAHLTDVETGQRLAELRNEFRVCCLALQPRDPHVFLCGGFSSEVKAWDCRSCQVNILPVQCLKQ